MDYYIKEVTSKFNRINFSLHYSYEDVRSFQWFNYHEPEKGQFKIDINYTGLLDISNVTDFNENI